MRADRLISILMLLQTHERMTADELSNELEVSPRTIYRDITALNVAGIPIYTERGPGGGIALLESYRTTLTGISEDEARALFMLSIPEVLVELGVGQKLKTALYKLTVALPQDKRIMLNQTQQRIYLDSTNWTPSGGPIRHLECIHQAVWQDKMLRLVYQGNFETQIEIEIAPFGLVAKMNTWHLVGDVEGYMRVIRVRDVIEAAILDQDFIRDEDFNLPAYWKDWCKRNQDRRSIYQVKLKVAPELIHRLPMYLGEAVGNTITVTEPGDANGWAVVIILFENFFRARESILSLGKAAEVLEPEALKLSVIDFARQIVDFYHVN